MGAIPKAVLPAIITRIRDEGSSLGQEAKALGMSYRTTLITALREFMGREAYDKMIEAKRPRTKGGVLLGTLERPRPDDAGLPVIDSMKRADGWTWRVITEHEPRVVKVPVKKDGKIEGYMSVLDGGERIRIMIDPDGIEYVPAEHDEKASLLRANPVVHGGPSLRYVLWEQSRIRGRIEKTHERGRTELQRGEAALERKRQKAKASPDEIKQEQEKTLKKASKKAAKKSPAKAAHQPPPKKKGKGKK